MCALCSGTEGTWQVGRHGNTPQSTNPGGYCMLGGEWTTLQCAHHRAQDTDSPAGLGDGWVEADDSQGCRYLHGTGHRTDWAGTSRARDRKQAKTTSTSSNGPPKGACTPAGRPRWGFHPCNHTANTTQVNQGGGPAVTVQDRPGPQACMEDTLAVMGSV